MAVTHLAQNQKMLVPLDAHSDRSLIDVWLAAKSSAHTRRAYRAEILRFLKMICKPLREIRLSDLLDFSIGLAGGSLRITSQNRALTAVKSLLSFGHETGYLPFNVGAALKLQPSQDPLSQRILDERDVARLIDHTPEGRNQVLLKLLYISGVRVSELAGLKWRDTMPRDGAGQLTVFGKGGKTRSILLKPRTWQMLLTLRENTTPEDPVFRSRKGGHLDSSQIRRIVYAAAVRAGLQQKVSPHWLRHAHASHSLDRSAPLHLVQATLGHGSVATTSRYLHARPTDSSSLYLPD